MYIQIYLASITFPEMLSFTCDGEHAFFFFPSLLLMYLIPHFYPETKKKKINTSILLFLLFAQQFPKQQVYTILFLLFGLGESVLGHQPCG